MTSISCQCGAVSGRVADVTPRSVNRVVCYCKDCRAFLRHLIRSDLLDRHGGSDIVQVAPARLQITHGTGHITAVRLSPRGLYRWYARCCNTPLGNTVRPAVPLIGIEVGAFKSGGQIPDRIFGEPVGRIFCRSAIGDPPSGSKGVGPRVMLRTLSKVVWWKLRGLASPNPFFDPSTGEPIYPVTVVTREEREALAAQ